MASWLRRITGRVHPQTPTSIIQKSMASMGSLTQSQLNIAVIELLDLRQNVDACSNVCRGNPITREGKRIQLMKMLSLVLIPLMVLSGMTINSLVRTSDNYVKASNIMQTIYFSRELGMFLQFLQRERDMSVLYVSSIGPKTKEFLLGRYPDTDESLQNLSQWPVSKKQKREEFGTKEKFVKFLSNHRYNLDIENVTAKTEMTFYTNTIEVFINWLYTSISESNSGSVWKSLVAYQEIITTSEYLGRERGFGVTFYANGKFPTRDDYLQFSNSQDVAKSSYTSAKRYSSLIQGDFDDFKNNLTLMNDISKMRDQIRSNNISDPSLKMAEWWFENMTRYQEVLRESQVVLATVIDNQLSIQASKNLKDIYVISSICAAVLLLTGLVVYGIYALTSQTHDYSISIAKRTKALNQEKRRTDTLLYQLLPKGIAEQLKKSQHVEAEQFKESTVFFSDIVGFTEISSRSSPPQVVDMLNLLYSAFDDKISQYDVYKVETVGDAYMVVSGVPKRNEKRHATEIVSMAMDLLADLNKLEIPHMPGKTFKLRIGCHSGSVVAGVVGTKMPRYCLFGETVTIASKMESLGKANHVHVSETTYDILCETGRFTFVENKDPVVKNDDVLKNAFRGFVHTYFLKSRDDQELHSTLISPVSSE